MRFFQWVLALALISVLLAGCGDEGGPESGGDSPQRLEETVPVSLTLNWWANPENVGILMAEELGYFDDAGIDVTIRQPRGPNRPIEYLDASLTDVGVTHAPAIVLAQEKGMPIVAAESLIPEATVSMIWLKKSNIDGIADLKGKTIIIPGGPYQETLLEGVLAQAGLSLSDITLELSWPAAVERLVEGEVDAIFGGTWNVEGVELEERGLEPVITRAAELGIPEYDELVFAGQRERVLEDPELFELIAAAARRGTEAAAENPRAAMEVIEELGIPNRERKPTEAALQATLPLFSETGELSPERAGDLVDWMYEEDLIQRKLSGSELVAE